MPFTLIHKSKTKLPAIPFRKIALESLGSDYVLSVAIVSPAHIQKLNVMYRHINKPTDILSFPLSKNEGEIYLCLSEAKKESKKFDRSYENFLAFLFIHGCVHLKGYDHGSTMEKIEQRIRRKFDI
jgi:probable rRNA maturation factor